LLTSVNFLTLALHCLLPPAGIFWTRSRRAERVGLVMGRVLSFEQERERIFGRWLSEVEQLLDRHVDRDEI
jgi:hypothetical protein